MAKLTIPFPEGTRTVALRGVRITIGRLPDNTIQLRDRTVSAHHAELIMEDGHYRIHDLDSSNGVLVEGQAVKDFHLREDCAIQLGEMRCEFHAGAPDAEGEVEILPGRGEVKALRQENQELKSALASLQNRIEAMEQARGTAESGTLERVAAERAALEKTVGEQLTEIGRLKESLAVMTRDRDNLQRAYDAARVPATLGEPKAVQPVVPAPTPTTMVRPAAPSGLKLPKPPGPLGGPLGGPGAPGALSPSTPARRPPSAVTLPPVRVIGNSASTGPKGTQKLVE